MRLTENVNNYLIEKRNGKYTVVCRSPKGGRCLKVLDYLTSEDLNTMKLYWEGMKKTMYKNGILK